MVNLIASVLVAVMITFLVAGTKSQSAASLYGITYTVVAGDTLDDIGDAFSMDPRLLCQYNQNLMPSYDCNLLSIGTELFIPNGVLQPFVCYETTQQTCYTILASLAPNDANLDVISMFFGLGVDDLLNRNQLLFANEPYNFSNLLYKNMQLRIPILSCPPSASGFSCLQIPNATSLFDLANKLNFGFSTLLDTPNTWGSHNSQYEDRGAGYVDIYNPLCECYTSMIIIMQTTPTTRSSLPTTSTTTLLLLLLLLLLYYLFY